MARKSKKLPNPFPADQVIPDHLMITLSLSLAGQCGWHRSVAIKNFCEIFNLRPDAVEIALASFEERERRQDEEDRLAIAAIHEDSETVH